MNEEYTTENVIFVILAVIFCVAAFVISVAALVRLFG